MKEVFFEAVGSLLLIFFITGLECSTEPRGRERMRGNATVQTNPTEQQQPDPLSDTHTLYAPHPTHKCQGTHTHATQ